MTLSQNDVTASGRVARCFQEEKADTFVNCINFSTSTNKVIH